MLLDRYVLGPAGGNSGQGRAHIAFTDRHGGYSEDPYDFNLARHVGDQETAVAQNRALLAQALGATPESFVFLRQVHGARVALADDALLASDELTSSLREADAVVAARSDVRLTILTADCAPVLLADPAAGVIGAAHAGRPGMLAGVVPATVAAMRDLGAERIEAVIGPTVCPRCYEVPAAMREEAAGIEPVCASVTWEGTPAIDVAGGVAEQLTRHGVPLRWSRHCTVEDTALFSHRREGTTGRQAAVIWLEH